MAVCFCIIPGLLSTGTRTNQVRCLDRRSRGKAMLTLIKLARRRWDALRVQHVGFSDVSVRVALADIDGVWEVSSASPGSVVRSCTVPRLRHCACGHRPTPSRRQATVGILFHVTLSYSDSKWTNRDLLLLGRDDDSTFIPKLVSTFERVIAICLYSPL
jgi:hypothetical protein